MFRGILSFPRVARPLERQTERDNNPTDADKLINALGGYDEQKRQKRHARGLFDACVIAILERVVLSGTDGAEPGEWRELESFFRALGRHDDMRAVLPSACHKK